MPGTRTSTVVRRPPGALEEVRRGLVEDRFEALLALGQAGELVPDARGGRGRGAASRAALGPADARPLPGGPSGRRPSRLPAGPRGAGGRPRCRARTRAAGPRGRHPRPRRRAPALGCRASTTRWSRCPPPSTPREAPWSGARQELDVLLGTWRELRSGERLVHLRRRPRGHRQDAAGRRAGGAGPSGRGHHLLRAVRSRPPLRTRRVRPGPPLRRQLPDAGAGRCSDRRAAGGHHRPPAGRVGRDRAGAARARRPPRGRDRGARGRGRRRRLDPIGRGPGGRHVPHGAGRGQSPHGHRAAAGRRPPRA